MSNTDSLAFGAELNQNTWDDFVKRLRHDTKGEGVKNHYTADAVFLVRTRVDQVVPEDYGGEAQVFDGCEVSQSPQEFYESLEKEAQEDLDEECNGDFLSSSDYYKSEALEKLYPDYSLIYVKKVWKTVNQHMTRDAAEAFIKRKKHDYPEGLYIYVDATTYSWEYNTIKEAILAGRIAFIG